MEQIEQWAEDYLLKLLDLCAELGIKIVPMFWGTALGWELATGYPWGFWKGGDYDLLGEGLGTFRRKRQPKSVSTRTSSAFTWLMRFTPAQPPCARTTST